MPAVINDIQKLFNLQFYSQDGNLIYSQKDYVITWKLLPSSDVVSYFHEIPEGYFAGEIDANRALINETLFSGFINSGKIYCDKYTYLNSGFKANEYMLDIFAAPGNKIRITVNINNVPYVHDFDVRSIFDLTDTNIQVKKEKIYTGTCNNNEVTDEYYYYLSYNNMALQYVYDINTKQRTEEYFIYRLLTNSITNIGNAFPFVYYSLSYEQEKVSTDFIAVDSIYSTPISFEKDTTLYSLVFKPEKDSEINIVKPIKDALNTYDIQYTPEYTYELFQNEKPLSLTVAFSSQEEGCYQNFIGMYLQQKDTKNIFFIGVIVIKTEVEGEDERYRALLGNFGIPDPKDYANIFSEQDYNEEGTDYKIVNEKSKELMLTYDQIFPYTGTYKALLNAIKFLGYSDIIFKEWYHIKDNNDNLTDVAIQRLDIENRKQLKDMLSQYDVSIEDFNNYSKMNKLTMVYHLNCIKENKIDKPYDIYRVIPITEDTNKTNIPDGFRINRDQTAFVSINPIQAYNNTYNQRHGKDVFQFAPEPVTEKIFKYTNSEVISKLWAVCKWLDKYILGVNSYIQDITAEGIIFSTFKTRGYVTQHELYDYKWQGSYTLKPNDSTIVHDFNLKQENTFVNLTLNEFTKLSFEDFNDDTFESFAREIYNIPNEYKEKFGIDKIYFSNTFENPINAEKYSIITEVQPQSISLNGIMIENNNIFQSQLQNDKLFVNPIGSNISITNNSITDTYILPVYNDYISIKEGYYYKTTLDKHKIINLKIYPIIDASTGNENYKIEKYSDEILYNISQSDVAVTIPSILRITEALTFLSNDIYSKYNTPLYLSIIFNNMGIKYKNNNLDNNEINFNINDRVINNLNIVNGDIILSRYFKDNIESTNNKTEMIYKISFHTEDAVNDINSRRYITPTVYSKFDFHSGYYTHNIDINTILQNSNNLEELISYINTIYKPVTNMSIPVFYNGKYNTKLITYDNHGNKFTTYQKNIFNVVPSSTGIALITDRLDNFNNQNNKVSTLKDINYKYTFNTLKNNSYYELYSVNHDRQKHTLDIELDGYNKPEITDDTYISFIPCIKPERFDYNTCLVYKKIGDDEYISASSYYNNYFHILNNKKIINADTVIYNNLTADIKMSSINIDITNKTTSFILYNEGKYDTVTSILEKGMLIKVRINVDNVNDYNGNIAEICKHNKIMESVFRIISIEDATNTTNNDDNIVITIDGILPLLQDITNMSNEELTNYDMLQLNGVRYTMNVPQQALQEYIVPLQENPIFYSKSKDHINTEMMTIKYNNTLFPIEQYTDDILYKPYLVTHNIQNKVLLSSIEDFIKTHIGVELDENHLLNSIDNTLIDNKLMELHDETITVTVGTEVLVHPLMNHYKSKLFDINNDINKLGDYTNISYCRIRHYVEQIMDMTNANMDNINTYNHRTLLNEVFNVYTIEKLIHKGKHTFIFDIYDRFGNHYQNSIQDIIYVK